MTASRSERGITGGGDGRRSRLIAAALPLALIVGFATPLHAQEKAPATGATSDQPLRLMPARSPSSKPTPPVQPAPQSGGEGANMPDTTTGAGLHLNASQVPEAMTGGGVQVDQLGAVDQGSVGVLTPTNGGFPLDMWHGTDIGSVTQLLTELPVSTESPAMRDAMRRLLLSRATTPAGSKDGGKSLVVLRDRMLLAMGDAAAALELADAVPHGQRDIALERITAEAHLVTGDYVAACRQASQGAEKGNDATFWDKLLIFCQAVAKENSKAQLGLAVQQETGDNDVGFATLINAIVNRSPAKGLQLDTPTPLEVAAAAVSGSHLDDGIVAQAGMPVVAALALAGNVVSPEARVDAAERAAAAGAIDAERLRDAYRKIKFTDADRNSALSRADKMSGPRARALLYQAADGETVPSARAEILGKAVEIAEKTGRPVAMSLAIAPMFRQLPVTSDFLWLAPKAVRTMLRVGDDRTAMSWFDLIRKTAKTDPNAANSLAELAPLIEAGTPNSPIGGKAALGAWWDVNRGSEDKHAQAAVLGGVLGALGTDIPASFWADVGRPPASFLEGTAPTGDPLAELRLQAMLTARGTGAQATDGTVMVSSISQVTRVAGPSRQGETAALALEALGAPGPAARPVAVSEQAIAAFDSVGLGRVARRLALETLFSHGL